jgi:hypothetical protein
MRVCSKKSRGFSLLKKDEIDAPSKNMFLQAVLSVKLKALSKIKELQILICALPPCLRLFAVESR